MTPLGTRLQAALPEGVRLREWPPRHIVNISGEGRDLTPGDVTALRAELTAAGCVEVRAWIATEGASWLSSGVTSVSFEIVEP